MISLEALANEVILKVRRQEFVSTSLCRHFFSQSASDLLRHLIRNDDIDYILSFLCRPIHNDAFRLIIHLLQGLAMYSDDISVKTRVRGILEGLWISARNSVVLGTSVCFGLLSFPDLSDLMRQSLFRFYLETWDYQCENQRDWSGGAQLVTEKVHQRLSDPHIPQSKHWIYVLALAASDDFSAITTILKNFEKHPDHLVQKAIIEVQNRLLREHPDAEI